MTDIYTLDYALEQDQKDDLKMFREKYQLNHENLIYLDGNSLGVLPNQTKSYLKEVIEKEWGVGLIRAWNDSWYERSAKIGAKLAKIIGAQPDEVIMADSTSVNLFKLAYAALRYQKGKTRIVSDELNFPSDLYVIQGIIDLLGNKHKLHLANSSDGVIVTERELNKLITSETALLTLSHVVFKSAFKYNMQRVTQMAHEKEAMVIWDLSHSVGSVPVKLNECNADLAIGCSYKYLNGGPGAPAFLYVRKDLQEKLLSPIWGWFGQNNPFGFELSYKPAQGIQRFLAGTPPLLSLSAIEPSLDIMLDAGMEKIRAKSIKQTDYLLSLFNEFLKPLGFTTGTPADAEWRGSHISIRHKEAYRICKALIDDKIGDKVIIPDFREPDNIRLGIAPLYNTFTEIFEAVMQIKDIVENTKFLAFKGEKEQIT